MVPTFLKRMSFTSRNSYRKFPLLTGLHRATDGALAGILVAVAVMSTVALHSQYLWTISFSRLQTTRGLTQRLLESTAVLENYHLKTSSLPEYMEQTKAKDLIYLKSPKDSSSEFKKESSGKHIWKRFDSFAIHHGY